MFWLHNPLTMPLQSDTQLMNYLYSSVTVYVTAEITEIDESIRDYDVDRRRCYYTNEKALGFFKIYTKSSCVQECMSNYTLKTCGCSQFFMVRDKDARVCGIKDMQCTQQVEISFASKDVCKCLPGCDEVIYKFENHRLDQVR